MSTYIHAYSKQHTYDRMTCEDRGVFIIQLRCDERERERERERETDRDFVASICLSRFLRKRRKVD